MNVQVLFTIVAIIIAIAIVRKLYKVFFVEKVESTQTAKRVEDKKEELDNLSKESNNLDSEIDVTQDLKEVEGKVKGKQDKLKKISKQ